MNDIMLRKENGQILASSREVAEKFGKENKHVNEDIRRILKSNADLQYEFILSTYINSRGRIYPYYLLTNTALNILITKYRYSAINPRFEYKFGDLLRQMFPSEIIISQYKILTYKIDFFMPELNIIIEYDEEQHKYSKEKDHKRINEIKDELNRMIISGIPLYDGDLAEPKPWLKGKNIFSVVRVKKGNEIDGLRNICIKITENTMQPCSNFMKSKEVA